MGPGVRAWGPGRGPEARARGPGPGPPIFVPSSKEPRSELVADVFNAVLMSPPQCNFDSDTMVVFQIIKTNPENRYHIPLHHLEQPRTLIRVAKCRVLNVHNNDPTIIVNTSLPVDLNLLHMAEDIDVAMRKVFRWREKVRTASARLRPYEMSTAKLAIEDQAAQSCALVPHDATEPAQAPRTPTSDELALIAGMDATTRILSRRGAFSGTRTMSWPEDFEGVAISSIEGLRQIGAAVVRSRDEFSEGLEVALVPDRVTWDVQRHLTEPVPLTRCVSGLAPLKKSKFELMIALQLDGWEPLDAGELLEPYKIDGDKFYRNSFQKPASYFACLAFADFLFKKGVTKIRQDRTNCYYLCLWHLDGQKLIDMLAKAEQESRDEFYAETLKASGSAAAVITDVEPGVHVSPTVGGDGDLVLALMAPTSNDEWVRCEVVDPASSDPPLRVFFRSFHFAGRRQAEGVCDLQTIPRRRVSLRLHTLAPSVWQPRRLCRLHVLLGAHAKTQGSHVPYER